MTITREDIRRSIAFRAIQRNVDMRSFTFGLRLPAETNPLPGKRFALTYNIKEVPTHNDVIDMAAEIIRANGVEVVD